MTTAYFYSACYVAAAHEAAFEKQGALTNRVMTLIVLHLIGTWVYSTGFCMLRFTSTCLPQRMTNHHALCSRHTCDKYTKQRSPHSQMDNRMLARLGSIELSNCRSTTILILAHRVLDNLSGSLFFDGTTSTGFWATEPYLPQVLPT